MSFTKWKVTRWDDDEPCEYTFTKETEYFYTNGRVREYKISKWHQFFDTKQQALEFIERRKASKDEQKRIDRIRSCGVELLEALEMVSQYITVMKGPGHEYSVSVRKSIAKARGEGV
jgi:hypothetical protein